MALQLSPNAKNALLNMLFGYSSYSYNNYLYLTGQTIKFKDAAGTVLYNGTGPTFGMASNGMAEILNGLFTPTVAGTIATFEIWISTTYLIASGTCSLAGGSGNLILSSLTAVVGTPISYSGTIKVPKSNGGTMRINQALATAIALLMSNTNAVQPLMASGGVIKYYNGTQPASADDAVSADATLLGTTTLSTSSPTFYMNGAGQCYPSSNTTIAVTPSASGTPTWARWTKGAYTIDFALSGPTQDAVLANPVFTAGTVNYLSTFLISQP